MTGMNEQIHIGAMIRNELARQGRSVHWLADELHTDRSNMYRILKKPYMDTDMLRRISLCLNHNFFAELFETTSRLLKTR